jgi:hypothetical protein
MHDWTLPRALDMVETVVKRPPSASHASKGLLMIEILRCQQCQGQMIEMLAEDLVIEMPADRVKMAEAVARW